MRIFIFETVEPDTRVYLETLNNITNVSLLTTASRFLFFGADSFDPCIFVTMCWHNVNNHVRLI